MSYKLLYLSILLKIKTKKLFNYFFQKVAAPPPPEISNGPPLGIAAPCNNDFTVTPSINVIIFHSKFGVNF